MFSKIVLSILKRRAVPPGKTVIVTACNSPYYKNLGQLLKSISIHEKDIPVIVYDLGLTSVESETLQQQFPFITLKKFPYANYPSYFDITVNAGEYAWKPAIIYEELNSNKCMLIWMDSANVLTSKLDMVRKITSFFGIYTANSTGPIKRWTHPGTLKFLNTNWYLAGRKNVNGAFISVDYKNEAARQAITQWYECALIKECIAPEGSSRLNHRQDQAVLSIILNRMSNRKFVPKGYYGYIIHQKLD